MGHALYAPDQIKLHASRNYHYLRLGIRTAGQKRTHRHHERGTKTVYVGVWLPAIPNNIAAVAKSLQRFGGKEKLAQVKASKNKFQNKT